MSDLTTRVEILRPKKDDIRADQRLSRLEHEMQDGQAQQDTLQKHIHELMAKVEYKPKSRVVPSPTDGLDQRVAQVESDLEAIQDLQSSMRQQLNEVSMRKRANSSPNTHGSGIEQRVAQLEVDLEHSESSIIKHIDELRSRVDSLATTRRRTAGETQTGISPEQFDARIRQVCFTSSPLTAIRVAYIRPLVQKTKTKKTAFRRTRLF